MKKPTDDHRRGEADLADEADAIVNRAAHFVEDWIEEHVVDKPIVAPESADAAQEMATQCIRDARVEGIEPDDIKDEVGDLKEYIAETLAEGTAQQKAPARGAQSKR